MNVKLVIALALAGCAAMPATAQQRPNEARDTMRSLGMDGLKGKKLAKAIRKAEAHPLGSLANPVRENMPQGQVAYLGRLRCADGQTPAATRAGNVGIGVYKNIVDLYKVTCPGAAAVDVHMDMYHDGPELRPVPGFTLADGA
jgi:hypothetical protein